MISLSLADLVLAYAGGLAVLVLLAWILRGYSRLRRESRRRRACIQCMFCGALYDNATSEPLPRCPQCAQPNERTPPSAV